VGLSRIGQEEGGKAWTSVYTPFCKIPAPWSWEGASEPLPGQPVAPYILLPKAGGSVWCEALAFLSY